MARSSYSAREKCSVRKSVTERIAVEETRGRERENYLLFSGACQARGINCRVIYCTTDFLGKFSTEILCLIEKLDCPVKTIKFLYGAVRMWMWTGIVPCCVSPRAKSRMLTSLSFTSDTE